jgi:DNA segregation ATPase FtsK/SpoIIIE, S-DNA-T family
MPQAQSHRLIVNLLAAGACLFALLSIGSFHVSDWPNPDVAPRSPGAVENLCGPVGAYLAYYCFYYFGGASYVFLFSVMIFLALRIMQKPVEQLILRSIGVILIGVVLSSTSYLISHGGASTLTIGRGGILGIAAGHFLLTHTALTGAIVILFASMIVGLLLSADNIILALPGVLLNVTDRLGKAGPLVSGMGGKSGRKPDSAYTVKLSPLFKPKAEREAAITAVSTLEKLEPKDELVQDEQELEEIEEKEPEKIFKAGPMVTEQDIADDSDDEDTEAEGEDGESEEAPRESSIAAVSTALAKMMGQRVAEPAGEAQATGEDRYTDYQYPPLTLLEEPQRGYTSLQERVIKERAKILEQTLQEFNIEANVVEAETGPVITMFELKLAPGIKVAQISNLSNDLARSLGSPAVRIVAPIPGKHTIGIEVPNSEKEKVRVKELLEMSGDRPSRMQIPLFLGKDASGEALVSDLTEMPHLLIAGTTGSGKSVCINSIIISIALTQRPDAVKLILVDPKMVEMNAFRDVPHLMCPIVTETKRAEQILEWLTEKMDERYSLLAEARVRNIVEYNKLGAEEIYQRFEPTNEDERVRIPVRLPYVVVVIDELADLMMTSAKEVEAHIIRLAQKSRAVGIHIVLATQRPQASVVTGLIKSNLPTRISFRVAARMDSRIVLDQNGAEALLGQGDMLFLKPGTSDLIRAQGTYLSDAEILNVVKHLKEVAAPHYHPELVQLNQCDTENMERDELFDDAVRIILATKRGSVSLLQRRLTIGYSRASRLIDQMAMAGIVGEYKGSQAREVLITPAEYEVIRKQMLKDEADGYADMQDDEDSSRDGKGAASAIDEGESDLEDASEDEEETDEEEGDEESADDEGEEEEKNRRPRG